MGRTERTVLGEEGGPSKTESEVRTEGVMHFKVLVGQEYEL